MRGPSYTGRVLSNHYAVGELLGEGGWGAVYAAIQTDLGRKVALKILHTDVALATEAVTRFQREARAAASLGHPNIVQVTDFQANPGEPPFLVMEMLTGATLGSLLQRQTCLPPMRVAAIMYQVLSALDVAHKAGIVHRDVKPDNVFLVSMPGIEDFVKLLDFGIAKLSAENQAQITDAGQMLGSPAFMSPEQVRSQTIDHRADIYAVGATMYFALAGRLPFDAQSIPALLAAIMEQKPKPLSVVAPGVDPRLAAIVERALHKDPHGRFASAADMRTAIEPWAVGAGSRPGMTPPITLSNPGEHANANANANVQQRTHGPMSASPTVPVGANPMSASLTTGGAGALGGAAAAAAMGTPMSMASSAREYDAVSAGAMPPNAMMMTPGAPAGPGGPPMMPMPMQQYQQPSNAHMTPYVSSQAPAYAPTPAPPQRSSGAILGILVAILAVVLLGVVGGGAALFYFAGRDKAAATTPSLAPSTTVTVVLATPSGTAPTGTASSPNGAARVTPGPHPGPPSPTPGPGPSPTPVVVVDAGGGGRLATNDAGGVPAKKQFAGATPRVSGGSFDKYDIDKSKAAINAVLPQLTACYAMTEFDPPDHQFTNWTFTIDPAGNVTNVKRSTEYDPHPKLDTCVIAALRMTKWQAIPGGGSPQVGLQARTRDNP